MISLMGFGETTIHCRGRATDQNSECSEHDMLTRMLHQH